MVPKAQALKTASSTLAVRAVGQGEGVLGGQCWVVHVRRVGDGHGKRRSSPKILPAAKCGRQELKQVINVAVLVLGDGAFAELL